MSYHRSLAVASALVVLSASVVGCGAGPGPSPTPTVVPSSASSLVPSAPASPGPSPSTSSAEFQLQVVPEALVGRSIPKALVVFLVTVTGEAADGPASITASAAGADVTVEPKDLLPGTVGEVTVIPDEMDVDQLAMEVTINAERGGTRRTETRTLDVVQMGDDLRSEADIHLAPFLPWLAANRPELGITPDTEWLGTAGSWVLVVSHYLYFSDDWELDLDWHVMIAPDDWCRISLRHRGTEVAPSLAFEISSFAGKVEPREIAPPDSVWR